MKYTKAKIVERLSSSLGILKNWIEGDVEYRSLLMRTGWEVLEVPAFIQNVSTSIDNLNNWLISPEKVPSKEELESLLNDISIIFSSFSNITTIPQGIDASETQNFTTQIGKDLFNLLIIEFLYYEFPIAYNFLYALNMIEFELFPRTTTRPGYLRHKVNFANLYNFIKAPDIYLKDLFGWGTADFDFVRLANFVVGVLNSMGVDTYHSGIDEDIQNGYWQVQNIKGEEKAVIPIYYKYIEATNTEVFLDIEILEYPASTVNNAGIIIQPLIPENFDLNVKISDTLQFFTNIHSDLAETLGVIITPDGIDAKYPLSTEELALKGKVEFGVQSNPSYASSILTEEEGSQLEIEKCQIGATIESIQGEYDLSVFLKIIDLCFTISSEAKDSFLKKALGEEMNFRSSIQIEWSSKRGFLFNGGGGFYLEINSHEKKKDFYINPLRIFIKPINENNQPEIHFAAIADIGGKIGPFTFAISEIGLKSVIQLSDGNLGPFGFDLVFSPPKGIALQIDAEGAKGGGYLFFDPDQERYAGAIELQLGKGKKKILVKAIGVLTTKLPNNEDGYSLLVLINAEFNPSIKLGMGFSLSGIGGLVGLHRSMNLPAFRAGVRNNSLSSTLFPQDPLQQINRIITDLEQFFPVQEDRHSFGLMAKLAWGPSKLMTMDVGILLELPKPVRVALIGVLKGILPTEDKPILVLQVNFAGTWDQARKYITFDASLYNSKLLAFPLIGDMALRILYGDEPNFLVSVGGFHPAFEVPPLDLPEMRRLTISLLKGEKPRLILSTYFALTSNTVQVGASIEFYFEILKKYALTGFLGFDALFQFSPFYFNVNFQALLALKNIKKNKSLFAIALGLNLEGPTPWHAKGYASFTIVGIPIKANIDKTFGKKENTILPDVAVLPKLKGELENLANWETVLPADKELQVTLRKTDGELVAHPYGVLSVTQKIVPLRFQMNKYGHQRPADYQKFDIGLNIGGTGPATSYLKEHFPPADFQNMSDAEKLSRKSFEKFDAGLEMIGHQEMKMSFFRQRACEYETVIMTNRYEPQAVGKQPEDALRFGQLQKGSASYQSPRSLRYRGGTSGPRVKIKQASFHVVRKDNLETVQGFSAASQAEARQLLLEAIELDPSLEGSIQVVPARLAI